MSEKIWVRNEMTGQEREMSRQSFKYHEAKRGGANSLRPKFTYLRDVEEPKKEKSAVQIEKERLLAEKAASQQAVSDDQTAQQAPTEQPKKAGRPAKPKEQAQ